MITRPDVDKRDFGAGEVSVPLFVREALIRHVRPDEVKATERQKVFIPETASTLHRKPIARHSQTDADVVHVELEIDNSIRLLCCRSLLVLQTSQLQRKYNKYVQLIRFFDKMRYPHLSL